MTFTITNRAYPDKIPQIVASHLDLYCLLTSQVGSLGIYGLTCTDPESLVRGGPTLTTFFAVVFSFVDGREDQNTTKGGPSLARQRDAI